MRGRHSEIISFLLHHCQMCRRTQGGRRGSFPPVYYVPRRCVCVSIVPKAHRAHRYTFQSQSRNTFFLYVAPIPSPFLLPPSFPSSLPHSFLPSPSPLSSSSPPFSPFLSALQCSLPKKEQVNLCFSGYITSCLWNLELIGTIF